MKLIQLFPRITEIFPLRNDGNKETLSFIGSPESVIGLALGGSLDFDFLNDSLMNDSGEEVKLTPPVAEELPSEGFANTLEGFIQPANGNEVEVVKLIQNLKDSRF